MIFRPRNSASDRALPSAASGSASRGNGRPTSKGPDGRAAGCPEAISATPAASKAAAAGNGCMRTNSSTIADPRYPVSTATRCGAPHRKRDSVLDAAASWQPACRRNRHVPRAGRGARDGYARQPGAAAWNDAASYLRCVLRQPGPGVARCIGVSRQMTEERRRPKRECRPAEGSLRPEGATADNFACVVSSLTDESWMALDEATRVRQGEPRKSSTQVAFGALPYRPLLPR
jgi:hypothetical protein